MLFVIGISLDAVAERSIDDGQSQDDKTLASFIYRLTQNVELPGNKNGKATLCTISSGSTDEIPAHLTELFATKKPYIKVDVVLYSDISEVEDIKKCDFLYVSPSEHGDTDKIVDATQNLPVVTISNDIEFAKSGGVIGFAMAEGMDATLEINLSSAQKNNITINAQLLKIAQLL